MNKLNEKKGYVEGLERFTDYVLLIMKNLKQRFIQQYLTEHPEAKEYDDITKIKYSMREYLIKHGKNNHKELTQPIIITENMLRSLGVNGVKKIKIGIYGNLTNSGMFDQYDSDYNGASWDSLCIELNLFVYMYAGEKEMSTTIQHEMTHAFEFARRVKMNGYDSAMNNFSNNKYYNGNSDEKDIVGICSYIFSKAERNAVISSLYTDLKRSNATLENYQEVIKESDYTAMLTKMNSIRNKIAYNTDNAFMTIIQWIKDHPEHVDMFPSIGNKSTTRYHKRLLQALDSVIANFQSKGKRIIKYYFEQKNGGK